MPGEVHKIDNHLRTGLISQALASRTDWPARVDGCLEAKNVSIKQQGGVKKRPGLRYVASLGNKFKRLYPWFRSLEQSYSIAQADDGEFKILSSNPLPGNNVVGDVLGRGNIGVTEDTRQFSADAVSVFVDGGQPYTVEVDDSVTPAIRNTIILSTSVGSNLYQNFGTAGGTYDRTTGQNITLTTMNGAPSAANFYSAEITVEASASTAIARWATNTTPGHAVVTDGNFRFANGANVSVGAWRGIPGRLILTLSAPLPQGYAGLRVSRADTNAHIIDIPINTTAESNGGRNFFTNTVGGLENISGIIITPYTYITTDVSNDITMNPMPDSNFVSIAEWTNGGGFNTNQAHFPPSGFGNGIRASSNALTGTTPQQSATGNYRLRFVPTTGTTLSVEGDLTVAPFGGTVGLRVGSDEESGETFNTPLGNTSNVPGRWILDQSVPNGASNQSGNQLGITNNGVTITQFGKPSGSPSIRVVTQNNATIPAGLRYVIRWWNSPGDWQGAEYQMPPGASISIPPTAVRDSFLRADRANIHIQRVATPPNQIGNEFFAVCTEYRNPTDFPNLTPTERLRTIVIQGNQKILVADLSRLTGTREEDLEIPNNKRRITACYISQTINGEESFHIQDHQRTVLPLVRRNQHTTTALNTAFQDLGNFRVQYVQFTNPPVSDVLTETQFNAEVSRIGADYCLNQVDSRTTFYGPEQDALPPYQIDDAESLALGSDNVFTASRIPSNFPDRTRLDTTTKIAAERVKGTFKFRQVAAGDSDLFRHEGRRAMLWNPTDGFPRAVGSWDTRLVLGGTRRNPNTLWFSVENRGFDFLDRSKNEILGANAREANSIIDANFALRYSLDKADIIENIYSSNSLIVLAQNTENILSGRIFAADLSWLRSQASSALGSRGSIGLADLDKQIFIFNGESATALRFVSDEAGYRNRNISSEFNEDIFLDSRRHISVDGRVVPNPEYGRVVPVIRVAGGLIRGSQGAYQVFYLNTNGEILVWHTLEDSRFFAWSKWNFFEGEERVGTQIIDIMYHTSSRRLFVLDNTGDVYIMDEDLTFDEFRVPGDTLTVERDGIECIVRTAPIAGRDLAGGGLQYMKRLKEVRAEFSAISKDRMLDDNNERVRLIPDDMEDPESYNQIYVGTEEEPPRNQCFEIPVNINSTGVYRGTFNSDFGYDESTGGRLLSTSEGGFADVEGNYRNDTTVMISHKGRGPFVLNRIDTTAEFEVQIP